MKNLFFTLMILSSAQFANATFQTSAYGKTYFEIDQILSFSTGHYIIKLEPSYDSHCPHGFWVADEAGSFSNNMLSIALSAYHATIKGVGFIKSLSSSKR